MLVEGIPEELGHEWRALHPFEIPGVRFPMDNTPPNQRRLAENDALVNSFRLLNTWRIHLHGDKEIIGSTPLRYGDPFYRERGRGRVEVGEEEIG